MCTSSFAVLIASTRHIVISVKQPGSTSLQLKLNDRKVLFRREHLPPIDRTYDEAPKLGAFHKLRHTNFMIFYPSPILVTGGHISETSSYLV